MVQRLQETRRAPWIYSVVSHFQNPILQQPFHSSFILTNGLLIKCGTIRITRAGCIKAHAHQRHQRRCVCAVQMSDREPTRWQHNRIYPHPINPCLYIYYSCLYCCETVDAHCSNIIKC